MARRLADALDAAALPYAIGGALALGVWGFPRATNDVDLNLYLEVDALGAAFAVFRRAGCTVDEEQALASARDRGDFSVKAGAMRVDVFVPSVPLYDSARTRIRQAPLEGRPAWFLSPEDLVVFKMLFFRTKDVLDVERLVAFAAADFDRAYVRRWLVDLVGADDERLARWDRLLADVDGIAR
ncbi:MAG: hypothetical protein HY907_19080 [Deltaproteobacteria bacterium]|nr:hypothetical protein [Deltaproteobacteria bacterium]